MLDHVFTDAIDALTQGLEKALIEREALEQVLARFGEAKQVVLADLDLEAAKRSAARVNRLLDREVAHACRVDVTQPQQLETLLREVDAFVSAVPYWNNPLITTAAIRGAERTGDIAR